MILAIFDTSYQVLSQMAFSFKEKAQNRFQDGSHLGFLIRTILAIFDLQVASILQTEFRVNWPFGSGKEVQEAFFDPQVTMILPVKI